MAEAKTKPKDTEPVTGLAAMRVPFPANCISKLPKPTEAQTKAVKEDFRKGHRCKICGSWHHPDVVHLDYVGHAALTDRLLDVDPQWNWEPCAFDQHGAPAFDTNGGLWIRLTVCGMTRLGYGHAGAKKGGDAIKEIIGDALRNAAMRFGAALDLWHKGDLHGPDEEVEANEAEAPTAEPAPAQRATKANSRDLFATLQKGMRSCKSEEALRAWGAAFADDIHKMDESFANELRAEYRAELNAFVDLRLSEEQKAKEQANADQ